MHARLTLEAGDAHPTVLDVLPGQPATLGRSRDNGLVIKDDLASRLHAKVYHEDGRWFVRDFGLNGTKVNGVRVSGSAELSDGAIIQVGETRLRFALLTEAAALEPILTPPRSTPRSTSRSVSPATNPHNSGSIPPERRATAALPTSAVQRQTPDTFSGTKPAPAVRNGNGSDPGSSESIANTRLKADELTALTRYMTAAVDTTDPHDLIRLALRTILHQTAARVAGYLSLDPSDPTPKLVLPEHAAVDIPLSKKLTERVRAERRLIWLFADPEAGDKYASPTESLSAFTDALCLPLASAGEPFAALHVYRTGMGFADRDVRFIEAVGAYLGKALELHRHRRKLEAENNRLRAAVPSADELIGDSSAMMALRSQIARAAPQPFTVLIMGESGSGKELVAQALHRNSPRANGPLVVVNCAAIAPTLLEAELFGYRKGAFSGADRDHPGMFEQADEGTLFLDEVGELTLECQAKLLRVIEGKPFRPVGGTQDVKVDVRVVAATHRDLEKEVKAGKFRQDLFFRLRVIPIVVPPLRDHAEDIPELARFFIQRLSLMCHRPLKLTPAAIRRLQSYPWPGNVRQLRAVLESAAVMCESDSIDAADLPLGTVSSDSGAANNDQPPSLDIDELETWAIRRALRQTGGNVSRAAQILGMSRDTLHTKLKKKAIDREELIAETAGANGE
jgi:Nif-specific regulatory protein